MSATPLGKRLLLCFTAFAQFVKSDFVGALGFLYTL